MSCYGRLNPSSFENMGKPWKQDEIDQLLQEVKENKDFVDIAELHKRTSGSIRSRLRLIAAELHLDQKKTIQECIQITGLSMTSVIDAIDKREFNDRIKAKKVETKEKAKEAAISVPQKPIDSVNGLRKDIDELKKDVKEILRLMNALYDFEASQE